jgi:hypothetical protein
MIQQLTLQVPSSSEEIDLRTSHSHTYEMPFFTMTTHLDNVDGGPTRKEKLGD